ncbi:MAG TPA: AMP-binding protein [Streptosporangiaceae bacterium]|nr:AMP-binding protein [Streptosporangiaceae bacterium]
MPDFLTSYAESQPDKPAVIDDRGDGEPVRWTYRELEERSNRLANALISLGIGPEDKVLWCGPNSPQVVAVINATRKVGAVAVPLNYRLTAEEARYVINHSDASVGYVDAEHAPMFAGLHDRLDRLRQVVVFGGPAPDGMLGGDFVDGASPEPPAAEPPEGLAGTMIFTSGTTGKPKGAVRHSRPADATAIGLIMLIGYTPDDVYLTSGPLYHSGPWGFMGGALALGQTIVVQRRFDPEDWLRLVDAYRVSSTFAAPAPIRMVCGLPAEVKARYDRSSMKRMIANAAPWTMALKERYLADFPADSLWEVYGSTELGVNCVLAPADQVRKPGSCGKPAPGVEIRLLDENGAEVTGTGPDHPGELFARSTGIFDDYYKQRESYESAMRGEFHTVGDIAYRDDEGYLYICDRKSDMIITGGMNVYPAEIEAALEQHPSVFEAAVFGIPSEDWGEAVHATVVRRPGTSLSAEDLVAFSREHLASYKIPRSVEFVDELPRTGSGKVLKRVLRAPYWAAEGGRTRAS